MDSRLKVAEHEIWAYGDEWVRKSRLEQAASRERELVEALERIDALKYVDDPPRLLFERAQAIALSALLANQDRSDGR